MMFGDSWWDTFRRRIVAVDWQKRGPADLVDARWVLTADARAHGWATLDVPGPVMYQLVVPGQYVEQITEREARRRQLLIPDLEVPSC